MVDREHLDLFKAKLQDASPPEALLAMAVQLRDNGLGQPELYSLFSYFQQRLSPEDPRYDAVVDTMDLIESGPWAKGHGLFPSQLSSDAIPTDRVVLPGQEWGEIGVHGHAGLERELALEMGPGHPLRDRAGRALMRRGDCDDVLFAVRNSPEVALVHLTWTSSPERPGFPWTTVFASMLDWYDDVENEAVE